jgi:hypothetical protein
MILIDNTIVLGQSGSGAAYAVLKPWHHASGVERWCIDPAAFTYEVEGYQIREISPAELAADVRYQAWLRDSQLNALQTQAQSDFSTLEQWIRTGTATQGIAWIDANVTTVASAKVALKHLVQIIIYLRDYIKLAA